MGQVNESIRIFFLGLLGFLIFGILLFIMNLMTNYYSNNVFNGVVHFLNSNFWLIVMFSIMLILGEIFSILTFPFNLPAPLLNAVGGIFLVSFLFNMFEFVLKTIGVYIGTDISAIKYIISSIVFVLIIVIGYIGIFLNIGKNKRIKERKKK